MRNWLGCSPTSWRTFPVSASHEADSKDLRESAADVLREVTQDEPKPGAVRRGVTLIKGLLAPIATGLGQAVEQETTDTARDIIDALGTLLPTLPSSEL